MKHLTLGLAAFTLLSLASGRANAEMLTLDCPFVVGGGDMYKLWVDMDKSTVTIQDVGADHVDPPSTNSAQITVTSISWSAYGNFENYFLDRTTGTLKASRTDPSTGRSGGPWQCERGTSPFPATKF